MSYRLIVRPRAEEHINETYLWYENKVNGLGAIFIATLETRINSIVRNPFLYQKKYKDIRTAALGKFPYGIYYFMDDKKIIITAVLYFGRNPRLWKSYK